MRTSTKLGTWYNVMVGNLKLDLFGRNLFWYLARAFHELYRSERGGVSVVSFVGIVYHSSDGGFEWGRVVS